MAVKRVGLVFNHFDFRTEFLNSLPRTENTRYVLFLNSIPEIYALDHEVRVTIYGDLKMNRFWKWLYYYFRRLPKSRNNFHLMERFKQNLKSEKLSLGFYLARIVRFFYLDFLSYDSYLSFLDTRSVFNATDIDEFIFLTDVSSDELMNYALLNRIPVSVIVYSWDHIYKFTKFTTKGNYIVWNEHLKSDLNEYWGVPKSSIKSELPKSFSILKKFVLENLRTGDNFTNQNDGYVLFCCSVGIPKLAKKEIELIFILSKYFSHRFPGLVIKVRPYPILADWGLYEDLKILPNVVVLFESSISSEKSIMEKYRQIIRSILVIHSGSTIGVESILLKKNAVMIEIKEQNKLSSLKIKHFIRQKQNEIFYHPNCFLNRIEMLNSYVANPVFREFNSFTIDKFEFSKFYNSSH